jgi:hypothetical protein
MHGPDRRPQYGKTPLLMACEEGFTKVALEIIERSSDLDVADKVTFGRLKFRTGVSPIDFQTFPQHTHSSLIPDPPPPSIPLFLVPSLGTHGTDP